MAESRYLIHTTIIIIATIINTVATTLAAHGEPCSFENTCDSISSLVCNSEGFCECNNTISTFNPIRKSCILRVGAFCELNRNQSSSNLCTENSECKNKTCTCLDDTFYTNLNGECKKKAGYEGPCSEDSHCGKDSWKTQLICNDAGRCDCSKNFPHFDGSSNHERGGLCYRYAAVDEICDNRFNRCFNSKCTENIGNKTCQCAKHQFKNSTGMCETKRGFGKDCQAEDNCDTEKGFKCGTEGTCRCRNSWEVYDPAKYACGALVGFPCEKGRLYRDENKNCICNAICNTKTNICTCDDGYLASENGTCLPTHGKACGSEWSRMCSNPEELFCHNNRCKCKGLRSWDEKRGKCVSHVDGVCKDSTECLKNGHCSIDEGKSSGICVCNTGYFKNEEKCNPLTLGKPCEDDNDCGYQQTLARLKCIEGTCQCNSLEYFDHVLNTCRGLAGASCTIGRRFPCSYRNSDDYCAANTTCTDISGPEPGKLCQCKSGYFKHYSDFCLQKRVFEEKCQSDEFCDEDKNLKCGTSGKCTCLNPHQVFDPLNKKCVELGDASCRWVTSGLSKAYICGDGANCISKKGHAMVCECPPGDVAISSNGTCLRSYESPCGKDLKMECNGKKGLDCKQGLCKCKNEDWQTFDEKSGKCRSNIYGSCFTNDDCVENSSCSADRKCECNNGFISVKGICYLSVGKRCEEKYNSLHTEETPAYLKCDPLAPLYCLDGTCQCNSWEVYDSVGQKCRGRVGSFCEMSNMGYCSRNAECSQRRSPKIGDGICVCKAEHLESSYGLCTESSK